MPSFIRRSLSAAVDAVRSDCVARLSAEYPDQRIELRPLPFCGIPGVYRFWVDGRPFGDPINLEDVVGHGIYLGYEAAVQSLIQPVSDELMMYLQTAA